MDKLGQFERIYGYAQVLIREAIEAFLDPPHLDLAEGDRSISEILELAKSEAILVHSTDGKDFVIEEADEFDREVAMLGASDKFMCFLEDRSQQEKDIPASEVSKRLGIDS